MKSAIVIGAGIVGLATARALSLKGIDVTVIERSGKAVGASIRNFGMIWPIGQPDGILYNRAVRSRNVWKEITCKAGFECDECGSLHLAYYEDEWQVLQELHDIFSRNGRTVSLLTKQEIGRKINGVNLQNLIGGLFSEGEMIIDPMEALALLPGYLSENHKIQFIWNKNVSAVEKNKVWIGKEFMQTDIICVCSGADFQTLFPEKFSELNLTKCKLQMMRFVSADNSFRIGTSLCGGLSLIHYDSFKAAPSLPLLKQRYQSEMSQYIKSGIHVMIAQNSKGEITVGDSHEYGLTFTPFDEASINNLIINYLKSFAHIDNWHQTQSWHGIYPKMTNSNTDIFLKVEEDVYIINGLGGAGMTLSFGFAEESVETLL
ncbi:MAG: TIGR03364 family FAD-dependent oxidoreductase [Bacteroidota bacterium]|nr:TIGR03364 family FAD-dependent oxidoreductase [Bacteroidota bacterium]